MSPTPQWYSLTPAGPVTLGNLTPVGQNSGQVGCRWPPNGHQLAACLNLPTSCQLWGPFWLYEDRLYVVLPQTFYALEDEQLREPESFAIHRLRLDGDHRWQVRSEHEGKPIKMIGGQYLISGTDFQKHFGTVGKPEHPHLHHLPWRTLTLSHNSREDYQVKDEGGFFAEMTTLLNPGWSLLVGIIGDYQPAKWGVLGAGGMPVAIAPIEAEVQERWSWLGASCPGSTGGVLMTGSLWQKQEQKISWPCPPRPLQIKAYAAAQGEPWQSWKKVVDRKDARKRVSVLTPGEWLTPAGAVYLWEGEGPQQSGPWPDLFKRHVLGYGHLWLFKDKE
jgi:hypothetical protein